MGDSQQHKERSHLVIDAYTHCGLDKYRPIDAVRDVMQSANVSKAVLVQHLGCYDNRYIGSIIAAESTRFAGVALVDHASEAAVETVRDLIVSKGFGGLRLTSEAVVQRPELVQVVADCQGIVVIYAPPDSPAPWVALDGYLDMWPALTGVISHLGGPPFDLPSRSSGDSVWRLSGRSNAHVLLSGMGMWHPYPYSQLYRFLSEVYGHFGPDRIMWGSNFPVVGSIDHYVGDLELLTSGRLPFPESAIPCLVGGNADRLWFR